jgi:hypothetical protein
MEFNLSVLGEFVDVLVIVPNTEYLVLEGFLIGLSSKYF